MDIGAIDNRRTWITHPGIGEKLLELVKEHPDYPIAVLVGEEANSGDYYWMYATNVDCRVEEILDCNSMWTDDEFVTTDREDFEDRVCDMVYDRLKEELGRDPTDEEHDEWFKKILAAHEPYWKKVIAITADN